MGRDDEGDFTIRVLIVVGIGIAVALLWAVTYVLVLAFGGIVLAAALRGLADGLAGRSRLNAGGALAIVLIVILTVLAGVTVLVGQPLSEQLTELAKTLPEAIASARHWVDASPTGRILLDLATRFSSGHSTSFGIAGFATGTFGAIADVLMILFIGIYVAADPGLYRRGALRLVPRRGRARMAEALDAAGDALGRWLRGQLISMVVVGTASGIGLWLLDVPLALAIGVFTGIMEFIPFVGPFISAIPAILIGSTRGHNGALWVAVFYGALHQIEGNILMPLLQRWAVSLPPALAIAAVVVFGILCGPLGVLFATPLMVVAIVLIEKLYVEPVIEEG